MKNIILPLFAENQNNQSAVTKALSMHQETDQNEQAAQDQEAQQQQMQDQAQQQNINQPQMQ
jgi:hypothetical protein